MVVKSQGKSKRSPPGNGQLVTLAELAEAKGLPVEFLTDLGVHDLPQGGVGIPYYDVAGNDLSVKRRTALKAKDGSWWPKDTPLECYGQWRVGEFRKKRLLILTEGESDVWVLWRHKLPALGVPGADGHGAITSEQIEAIEAIYIFKEPDQGGERFVPNVVKQLAKLDYTGQVYEACCPDGVKDPADLYLADPEHFQERIQEALRAAKELKLPTSASTEAFSNPWPEPLPEAAYHGLAGRIVRTIEPHSEADPVALLVQVLIGFGGIIGRTAHFIAEDDTHYLNEFGVLIGKTSKGRKGSSWSRVRRVLDIADMDWVRDRIQSGLSSGEGLIWSVRDPILTRQPVKERGRVTATQEVETDPGVNDKRLLVYEPEFVSVLKQIERQGNTLSAILRQAWDGTQLRTLTKHSPCRATGAHVSFIGHCTVDEIRRYLTGTEAANGYGNRHLWLCVNRSKVLPEGSHLDPNKLSVLGTELSEAVSFAKEVETMRRDDAARELWRERYTALSEGKPGLSGSLLARAEAHVMRLACLYALLDGSCLVGVIHLEAALALWAYVERSVRFVFGDSLGDPVADEILRLLRVAPQGVSRTEIYEYFGRHQTAEKTGRALALLLEHDLARFEKQTTGGRPKELWFAKEASA